MKFTPESEWEPKGHNTNGEGFLPVDEISGEHLRPELAHMTQESPEDLLIANEEVDEWQEWIRTQLNTETNKDEKEASAMSRFVGDEDMDEHFRYWERINNIAKEYEKTQQGSGVSQEEMDIINEKYHFPAGMSSMELRALGKRARQKEELFGSSPLHSSDGNRGPERKGKHKKGGDSIRGQEA